MNTHDCCDVEALLGPYLDSELDAKTSLEVSLHLKACPTCAARLAEETAWQQKLSAALSEGPITEGLWEAIEARICELDRAKFAATLTKAASAARHWRYWLWPSPRLYAGLVAAWALILGIQLGTREPGSAGSAVRPETRTALIEQRHLLAELLGTSAPETDPVERPAPPQTDARQPSRNGARHLSALRRLELGDAAPHLIST